MRHVNTLLMSVALGIDAIDPSRWRQAILGWISGGVKKYAGRANEENTANFIRTSDLLSEIEVMPELNLNEAPDLVETDTGPLTLRFIGRLFEQTLKMLPPLRILGSLIEHSFRVSGFVNGIVTVNVDSNNELNMHVIQLLSYQEGLFDRRLTAHNHSRVLVSRITKNLSANLPQELSTEYDGRQESDGTRTGDTVWDLVSWLYYAQHGIPNRQLTVGRIMEAADMRLQNDLAADSITGAIMVVAYSGIAGAKFRMWNNIIDLVNTAVETAVQRELEKYRAAEQMIDIADMQRHIRTEFLALTKRVRIEEHDPLLYLWLQRVFDHFWLNKIPEILRTEIAAYENRNDFAPNERDQLYDLNSSLYTRNE